MPTEQSPPPLPFTKRERRLIERLRTPADVQRFLNALPYNTELPPGRATLRSFRSVVRHQTAHCLEAVLTAAVVLEQHGYPPLALSFESVDELDHVLFVYRHRGSVGLGGAVAGPRAARAQAGVSHRAGVGAQLCRALRGLHRSDYRIRGGRPAGAEPLRLAALGAQRLEGGACATRRLAPTDSHAGPPHRPVAGALSLFHDAISRSEAGVLRGPGAMEQAPRTIPACDRTRRYPARLTQIRGRGLPDPPSAFTKATAVKWPRRDTRQSRSNSRSGRVIGSCWACLSASSKRFERVSPRVFSSLIDC